MPTRPAAPRRSPRWTSPPAARPASFYYRGTRAGTPTLTAAPSGLTDATQVETIALGLVCRASAEAEAGNAAGVLPPEIVTTPALTATCGEPYAYGQDGIARATGSRPLTWSLGQGDPAVGVPAGMTIDANGQIQWTPPKKAAQERVTVVAENGAGVAQQDFVVDVQCPNPDPFAPADVLGGLADATAAGAACPTSSSVKE